MHRGQHRAGPEPRHARGGQVRPRQRDERRLEHLSDPRHQGHARDDRESCCSTIPTSRRRARASRRSGRSPARSPTPCSTPPACASAARRSRPSASGRRCRRRDKVSDRPGRDTEHRARKSLASPRRSSWCQTRQALTPRPPRTTCAPQARPASAPLASISITTSQRPARSRQRPRHERRRQPLGHARHRDFALVCGARFAVTLAHPHHQRRHRLVHLRRHRQRVRARLSRHRRV